MTLVDEDDRWHTTDTRAISVLAVNLKGLVTLVTAMAGALEPGEPEYDFRRWVWDVMVAALGTERLAAEEKSNEDCDKVMRIISRSGVVIHSEIVVGTPRMKKPRRDAAIAKLLRDGVIEIVPPTDAALGRPPVIYRLKATTPAAEAA